MIDSDTHTDQLQSDYKLNAGNIDPAGGGQHSPVEANMDHATHL